MTATGAEPTIVRVVSALILNEKNEMLMTLRGPTAMRPNCWENPGGKVEANETLPQALHREIREELGVSIEIGEHVASATIDVEVMLHLTLYEVRVMAGEPRPLESVDLTWLDPTYAIKSRICAPATYSYYRGIVNFIARRGLR